MNSPPPTKRPESPQLTLTRPPTVVAPGNTLTSMLSAPLGLAYLAAYLRENGFSVAIVDPIGEAPFEQTPVPGRDLVTHGWNIDKVVAAIPASSIYIGVSCTFSQEWPIARELIGKIRARFSDAIIVAGGEHMTAAAEYSLHDSGAIDFVVLGEGEETLFDLLQTLEAGGDTSKVDGIMSIRDGEVFRTQPRQRIRQISALPLPAWDLVPIESYLSNGFSNGVSPGRTMPLLASRGCPYRCTFCSNPAMWTTRWLARNSTQVVDEIEYYVKEYQADNFDFCDPTAIVKKRWMVEFCNELIARNLNITWQLPSGTRSEVIDDELLPLLVRSGHRNLVYAPESGSERILPEIKKRVNLPQMMESMSLAVRHSISVKLNMIMGFPMESPRDIIAAYGFLAKVAWIGVDDVEISTFVPYPGSELFTQLREAGRIGGLNDDYFFGLAGLGAFGTKNYPESYSSHLGSRTLFCSRIFGMLLFYGLSFLCRPTRIFNTALNIVRRQPRTRLEKKLGYRLVAGKGKNSTAV
jgi:anaerobic magnesium-protoporphyrin IX monomethyl ester cyclase